MKICVFGAASSAIDNDFKVKVKELGKVMAQRGHSLVFGGGANGLMGAVADGVHAAGGYILGVIPKFFEDENVEEVFPHCNELIEPDTMRQRKQIMEDNADAFIIVPGGIGTFEEFFEILTLKQLCRHEKPIAVYNLQGYYDDIQTVMHQAVKKGFVREDCLALYEVTDDLEELLSYVENPEKVHKTVTPLKDG